VKNSLKIVGSFLRFSPFAGSQIQSQQSNIALLSALLLTIQFAFLYAFPGSWGDLLSDSYLANLMTEDQLEVLHEVPLCNSSILALSFA
jgi:hypothetical protein